MKPALIFVMAFLLIQKSLGQSSEFYPASDPENMGGWVLNEELSDEFVGDELDRNKWFIEGENGDYYIWKGRAPVTICST